MPPRLAHWLGSQLAHPQGAGGWLVGQAMRIVNRQPIRLAVDALDPGPDDVALDLGCGPGNGIALLARRAGHVYGVDASPAMLALARRTNRAGIAAGRVALRMGQFDRIPLPAASVDRVLAANVAYFWSDVPSVLTEIRRIMRPGGRLVLYVTDAATMRGWAFADQRTHRHFDEARLREAMAVAGVSASQITVNAIRLPGGIRGLICSIDF